MKSVYFKVIEGEMLSVFFHRRFWGDSPVFRLAEAIFSISCVWIFACFGE